MSHTREPWRVGERTASYWGGGSGPTADIHGSDGDTVNTCDELGWGMDPADARRIVACVNACAGISTEYLESIEGLEPRFRQLLRDYLK